jgi:hypothetical protein
MNLFRKGILLAIIGFGLSILSAVPVQVEGYGEGYEGQEIRIFLKDHPFLDIPIIDTTLVGDPQGRFTIRLDVPAPSRLYIASGIYEGNLFIQSGKNYSVVLPRFQAAEHRDRISPFFEPSRLTLRPEGPDHPVNQAILHFDSLFLPLNEQVAFIYA